MFAFIIIGSTKKGAATIPQKQYPSWCYSTFATRSYLAVQRVEAVFALFHIVVNLFHKFIKRAAHNALITLIS